jgi:cell division protein FtsB
VHAAVKIAHGLGTNVDNMCGYKSGSAALLPQTSDTLRGEIEIRRGLDEENEELREANAALAAEVKKLRELCAQYWERGLA